MKQTIKSGVSTNGIVLTDMPLEMLKSLRDSVDDAIKKAEYERHEKGDKYVEKIIALIVEAQEEGINIYCEDFLMTDSDISYDLEEDD